MYLRPYVISADKFSMLLVNDAKLRIRFVLPTYINIANIRACVYM